MDISAELKELRKQLYTYRYKSLELERQLRTHCHILQQPIQNDRDVTTTSTLPELLEMPRNPYEDVQSSGVSVFTNGLVMEIVASHLAVRDLLHCRLVCKSWAQEMGKYLTKRRALVVAYEDCSEANELLKRKEEGKFVNISTLCILEISITSSIILNIVKVFGETISGLKLDDCHPSTEELYSTLKFLPSLEILSFKQTGGRRNEESVADPRPSVLDALTSFSSSFQIPTLKKLSWEESLPIKFLDKIITTFPALEELELFHWSKPNLNCMQGIRLDTLKTLTISCNNDFSAEHFSVLANLELKLQKLTLHDMLPGGRKQVNGLRVFLKSIAKTILEINLSAGGSAEESSTSNIIHQSTPFPIEFPLLKKLTIDSNLVSNLKLLNHMPNLTKFECKIQDWKAWWHLLNASKAENSHGTIRELTLGAIDSGCLSKIINFSSTITKLDVTEDRIDDVAFRIISTNLMQLRHLRITSSTNSKNVQLKLSDVGVTGIPADELTKLSLADPETIKPDVVKKLRKHPFIGDIQGLNYLELSCSASGLTDCSVLYGIAGLRRISTITLPKCKLTDASLVALEKIPSLLVLDVHKHCGVTTEGVARIRTQKTDLVVNLYVNVCSRNINLRL